MGEKPRIRAAVIGCGGMGRAHVQTLLAHEGFELAAGCDVNPQALAQLPDGVGRYEQAEPMLRRERPDLVCIIVPNDLYEPMVALAAQEGACVFCEKPLGNGLENCRRIVGHADRAGVRGWVGAQRKYLPHFQRLRRELGGERPDFILAQFTYYWAPAFGDMRWRGERARSGGVAVIDSGWHLLDCLSWLAGRPQSVFARCTRLPHRPEIDDRAAVQLTYPWGGLANLTISYTIPRDALDITVMAGRRALCFGYDGLTVYDGSRQVERVEAVRGADEFRAMYDELWKALQGDPDAYVTDFGRAGEIMEVVEACYESDRSGRTVRL